jgi:hypothetical protein
MNKDLLKNRKFQIVVGVVILVLVGGFLVFKNITSNSQQAVNNNVSSTEVPVPTITADQLGLTLKAGPLKRTVIVTVANTTGISAIEYELSYISKGDIPRGAIGQMDLAKTPSVKEITLGTCSDVCHYDTGVSNIKIILKITKNDGNVYSSTATLDTL